MNTRIAELIRSEGLTAVKFAEILGVQPSNISHILSGRNKPGYDFIVKLLEQFPNINPEWIILGKGDIYKSKIIPLDSFVANVNNTDLFDTKSVYNSENTQFTNNFQTNAEAAINNGQNIIDSKSTSTSQLVSNAVELNHGILTESDKNSNKKLVKIILLYSDNSFEVFDK